MPVRVGGSDLKNAISAARMGSYTPGQTKVVFRLLSALARRPK